MKPADVLEVLADCYERRVVPPRDTDPDSIIAACRAGRMALLGTHPGVELWAYRSASAYDPGEREEALLLCNSDQLYTAAVLGTPGAAREVGDGGRHHWRPLIPPIANAWTGRVIRVMYRPVMLVGPDLVDAPAAVIR